MDKLKGKKIVNLYHDSAYGKEPIPVLDAQAKKYGFDGDSRSPCRIPGNEQESQWLQIRQAKPDYVILCGWGVMNPVALKTAAKVGYPARQASSACGGRAPRRTRFPRATRRRATSRAGFNVAGTNFPVIQDIKKNVYGARARASSRTRRASAASMYNRGVVHGILTVEAIRKAQEKYGKGR